MDYLNIIGIGVGLAMDALAVSVASGLTIRNLKLHHAVRIALTFGLFQAGMPVIGWTAGIAVRSLVLNFAPWVAFGLLVMIGGKMVYESFTIKEVEEGKNPLHMGTLLFLGVATSIDALAVGVTFAMIHSPILVPVIIIGGITFLISLAGVYIGDKFGHFFENKFELAGGVILIGIGVRILLKHLL